MDDKRIIKKVAVLGSGVMGSRIACHFANIGLQVLLLDIVPKDAAPGDSKSRNKIVNDALDFALKSNPSPVYLKSFANRITTGNFEDDLHLIDDCDWVIEVVIERLDIKQQVFKNVEQYRKPGTLITSNTSGIPIYLMTEGRSDDFKKHFCGTHFFNPPRYLKLLEIIPTKDTLPAVTKFLTEYGEKFLGKTTVLAKDTPAFIGNRIGVFSVMSTLHYADEAGMTVEEIDELTGPIIGHPKSATFRTIDVVGLDTVVHVSGNLKQNVPDDEANKLFGVPGFVTRMLSNNLLGSKTGQGFYKKEKVNGTNQFYALNLNTLEYNLSQKVQLEPLATIKTAKNLVDKLRMLIATTGKAGDFYRATFYQLFAYASNRIPEIADELYKIDAAMKAGFGWEMGPFEKWDAIGVEQTCKAMQAAGYQPAQWVYDMLAAGIQSFYKAANGKSFYYDIKSKTYRVIPGADDFILLGNIPVSQIVWENGETTITNLGDGILNLEFHTKMNTIGSEMIEGINKAITLAEAGYKGLVIANEGVNFSVGANLGMVYNLAAAQNFKDLEALITSFQNVVMRIRYSAIPVVIAVHNMALGGACEMSLHADMVVAHAELNMGLVECRVGLIPGGAGTKEFALRLSDELQDGDIELNNFRSRFLTIAQAKVSTSAYEAFELGYLKKGRDIVVVSRGQVIIRSQKTMPDDGR